MLTNNGWSPNCYICFSLILILLVNNGENRSNISRISFVANSASTMIVAQKDTVQQPTPKKSWYTDSDALTAIASVGALIISIIALLQAYQNVSEQRQREKREELRNSLEKLINFREELDGRINKIIDPNERVNLSLYLNTKRSVYIQAAESVAAELASQISSSEYIVLAAENYYDSDFLQAREFYEKAVEASRKRGNGKLTKCIAMRALSWSFYWQEPYRNIAKGRQYYQKSVDIMAEENDLYSIYTIVLTYREWATQEIFAGVKENEYTVNKLNKAHEYLEKLPDWYGFKNDELRGIASAFMQLGAAYFQDQSLDTLSRQEKARQTFSYSLNLLQSLNDDTSKDLCGQICLELAKNEFLWGEKARGDAALEQAKQYYTNLSETYSPRPVRLTGLENFVHFINSKLSQKN
jgi:hypothetical protein